MYRLSQVYLDVKDDPRSAYDSCTTALIDFYEVDGKAIVDAVGSEAAVTCAAESMLFPRLGLRDRYKIDGPLT
jgi:hypothetical protein